jgi:hypothetical protein
MDIEAAHALALDWDHEMDRVAQAEADAEYAAEMAVERWYEDRGWMEAALQEEMEARAGVIPFHVAMAAADAEAARRNA